MNAAGPLRLLLPHEGIFVGARYPAGMPRSRRRVDIGSPDPAAASEQPECGDGESTTAEMVGVATRFAHIDHLAEVSDHHSVR